MNFKTVILTLCLFVPAVASAQTGDRARYIDYQYKGVVPSTRLPNGVKHIGGGLIGDIEAATVYGISQVERGRTKMLWLEASTGKDASGVTGWKVLDVLSFPALASTDYMFFYGDPAIGCTREGKDIANLVGVGRILRRRGTFTPTKLWVANLTTKKFDAMAITGVKCVYSEP